MKKKSKVIGILSIASLLIGALSASAYTSPDYNFEVHSFLDGSTIFSLENKSTNTKVKADTLHLDHSVSSSKAEYTITLYKDFLHQYPMSTTANDTQYILGFGAVPAGDYHLRITKNGAEGYYVTGTGNINQ